MASAEKAYRQHYQESAIASSKPEDLTLMLFNGLIKFIARAQEEIRAKNYEAAHNTLVRCQDIVFEFQFTLNMDYEISDSLMKLYDYIYNRLIEANAKKDCAILDDVSVFATGMRDTWAEAMRLMREQKAAEAAGDAAQANAHAHAHGATAAAQQSGTTAATSTSAATSAAAAAAQAAASAQVSSPVSATAAAQKKATYNAPIAPALAHAPVPATAYAPAPATAHAPAPAAASGPVATPTAAYATMATHAPAQEPASAPELEPEPDPEPEPEPEPEPVILFPQAAMATKVFTNPLNRINPGIAAQYAKISKSKELFTDGAVTIQSAP